MRRLGDLDVRTGALMRRSPAILFVALFLQAFWLVTACHKNPPNMTALPQAPEAAPPPTPGPPVCKLTAEPAAIEQGKSVTLSWTSGNATDVTIDPGLGKQLTEGSTTASPEASTTYILTATGPGGTATCTARTTVSPAAPPSPSVSEENIASGAGGGGPWTSQIKDVFFDYDSADLRPDSQEALTADAALFKGHSGVSISIEGNCDQRGSEEYNLGLGQRRANAARDFLVNLGIPAGSLSTISYGKDRLSCADNTDGCWQQNRRDHLALK
jgi:peptidoglycan-associated lipoprotein